MNESDDVDQITEALAGWQAFAADGRSRMRHELALSARCDQLFPVRPYAEGPQPTPLHFYGPGPDSHNYIPVGTLHFARWRHEIAAFVDPDGFGYYHEENPLVLNGQQIRPTYITKGNQLAKEVNYFRWARVPAETLKGIKTYPGPGTTRAVHDEYLLNQDDFNDFDTERRKIQYDLDNRKDEDPKVIYPLGYKLLKKWSRINGYPEWTEGSCLGADPNNPHALTKHIGWFPKRLRRPKSGLGADPQDAIWKEVFHGNLDAKPNDSFIPPKEKWSEDSSKVTIMTGSKSPQADQDSKFVPTFHIVSLEALKASLPPPQAETLSARKAWLEAQAIRRFVNRAKTDMGAPEDNDGDLGRIIERAKELAVTPTTEMTVDEKDIESTDTEATEQSELSEINGKAMAAVHENKSTSWDAVAEEREAIQATLDELSRNPEPGKEGKTPILAYSAFRSRFLGRAVTQVIGYE
ncbi:hypothetical protein F5Y08DRAFT_334293 [Xylaria arbuscula]|nr:hypothetical protein F5Y08DRAFT_334293 [Xylaria arbuscula]